MMMIDTDTDDHFTIGTNVCGGVCLTYGFVVVLVVFSVSLRQTRCVS